ncbi:Disease resistance protein RGA2 [Rhynchospora pubera]|uniref:Disease resistance protein RGA2 n=1 Tax=Rhynchospora pubera TaxID=906938 RepID=A0AAV8F180_9POAL|nr:Disease resistance protein RGA2 [Rhynchospora pubera]
MLRGNPLAAKVIGSLLNSRMDQLYWRRILNHNSLINLEQAKDVMEVLKLSYYNLPADLQVCFRFCSIFSQDFEFDKRELIEMWMASGFLRQQSCQEKRPEDIGEDYFNHLLRKSFFECSRRITRIGPEKRHGEYVIHDLMHELAENVSNGECFRVAPNDNLITIPSTVRHISIQISEIHKASHLENIRSLVITPCYGTNPDLFVLPNNLIKKSLRLLKIYGSVSCRLPVEISCLVHLRYLSIEVVSVKFLSSIYMLYHLQVLEFLVAIDEPFYSGVKKKHEMTNLVSLRYMRLPHHILQTICGVHKLTSLQELSFFVGQESGHQINELSTLNNLRNLDIYNIENIRNPSEAASANLLGKESLRSLSLNYTSNTDNPEQIIDNLKPQPNLMTLKIENYKGQQSPIWLKDMPYLKILHIYNSPKLDKLPDMPLSLTEFRVWDAGLTSLPDVYQSFVINTLAPLSLKSSLRSVEIKQCPNLISLNGFLQQGNLDLGGLEELRIERCENLVQLPTHAFKTFVSLNHLSIGDCPNLTRLPHLPLSLNSFHIYEMSVSTLPEHLKEPGPSLNDSPSTSSLNSSLKEVHITMCPNLTALNGFLQQDNIDFQAINIIEIWQCENLVHISRGAFGKFVSLTDLTIYNCPKLAAVENQNNLLPSKLKRLFISNCGELDVPLLESSSKLTTLTQLEILDCANITRIPSSEHVFASLSKLDISRCDKLIELSLMQQQHHNVDQGSNLASLKINELYIDQLSLLLIDPLRSLRSVSDLRVHDCSRLETLPEQWLLQNSSTLRKLTIWNANTVQSLPTSMVRLTALEELSIRNADFLVELPELPASLKFWTICSSDGTDKFK